MIIFIAGCVILGGALYLIGSIIERRANKKLERAIELTKAEMELKK